MSQSVDKLKELLFKPENEAIASLSKRLDAVFDRAGTQDRFKSSVAQVLDGALREAEVARHEEVAAAIAPLIVRTVKAEISNSTDELVEALYPATGRMVKAYVANAIKQLTDDINRRLEANPVMLRVNALLTGRSVRELAFADSQRLRVDDVLLVRRATGALVARWPAGEPQTGQEQVMGSVLTAINEFTSEAFKADGSSLRQIDMGESQVFLRVSPSHLLAARCSGTAPPSADQIFDDEFLALLDRHHAALEANAGPAPTPLLRELSEKLTERLSEIQPAGTELRRGVSPVTLLAFAIGLPLLGWLAWSLYVEARVNQIAARARGTIEANSQMKGFPTDLKVTDQGRVIQVSGLAPSSETRSAVLNDLRQALPGIEIRDYMGAVPAASVDITPVQNTLRKEQADFEAALATDGIRQGEGRAARLLDRAVFWLRGIGEQTADSAKAGSVASKLTTLSSALRAGVPENGVDDLVRQLKTLIADLQSATFAGLKAPGGGTGSNPDSDGQQEARGRQGLIESAERVLAAARGFVEIGAVKQRLEEEAQSLRAAIAALPPPVVQAVSPREHLERFVRSHAVFFLDGTTFRNDDETNRLLDELATLIKADTSVVRVVGYTDGVGTPALNATLSRGRAEAVVQALTARGVSPSRLAILNRSAVARNVSPVIGPGSANRRVEFELGFIGEAGP